MTIGGRATGGGAAATADLVDLLRRVAARDEAAFAALYRQTSAKLYGVVARILSRGDAGAEALQEAYVRIWEKAGDFDPAKGSPLAWMATIARNRALDEVRRVRPASLEDMPEGFEPAASPSIRWPRASAPRRWARCSIASPSSTRRSALFSCSPIITARAAKRWPSASAGPCRRSRPGCTAALRN